MWRGKERIGEHDSEKLDIGVHGAGMRTYKMKSLQRGVRTGCSAKVRESGLSTTTVSSGVFCE